MTVHRLARWVGPLAGLMFLLAGALVPATAGVLELIHDGITTHCDDDAEPCLHNDLGYQTHYVRDRYLRYGIKTTKARYTWVRERVMIAPPRLRGARSLHGRIHEHGHGHKINGKLLMPVGSGARQVVAPARYATVTRRVLVSPARHRVVRKGPHEAYYAETLIVRGRGCKRPLNHFKCH